MSAAGLTVLVHDGPIAHAYLSMLTAHGIVPQRIIYLAYNRHQATGKKVLPWMPAPIRRAFMLPIHSSSLNYWPRTLRSTYRVVVEKIQEQVASTFDIPLQVVKDADGAVDYNRVGNRFELLMVDGLEDPNLFAAVAGLEENLVLFTGGGFVPTKLLLESGCRFLHIHPGFLPRVRGADCLLWSVLMTGQPGASAFYMAPGLDEGDIVLARELPKISIPLRSSDRPDDRTLYRLTYSFIDPWVRAAVLAKVIEAGTLDASADGVPQDPSGGVTHHFMHNALRSIALSKLFPDTEVD